MLSTSHLSGDFVIYPLEKIFPCGWKEAWIPLTLSTISSSSHLSGPSDSSKDNSLLMQHEGSRLAESSVTRQIPLVCPMLVLPHVVVRYPSGRELTFCAVKLAILFPMLISIGSVVHSRALWRSFSCNCSISKFITPCVSH